MMVTLHLEKRVRQTHECLYDRTWQEETMNDMEV